MYSCKVLSEHCFFFQLKMKITVLYVSNREAILSSVPCRGRILGRNEDKSLKRFPVVYGNLKSENSHDYAQKPQRNCTSLNTVASGLRSPDNLVCSSLSMDIHYEHYRYEEYNSYTL
jgi:hypothetical protein